MIKKTGIELTGNELGNHVHTKDLRKAAMLYAQENFIGKMFLNENSGHLIKVTRQGIKHSLAMANRIEIKLITGLSKMLQTASYTGYSTDRKYRNHIKAIHKYALIVEVNLEEIQVGLVTRETIRGYEHYDHFAVS